MFLCDASPGGITSGEAAMIDLLGQTCPGISRDQGGAGARDGGIRASGG